MSAEVTAYWLTLGAAGLHAGWNFVCRKFKGDFTVLWLAQLFGLFILLPITLLRVQVETILPAIPYILGTGVAHAFYVVLLSLAYETGDISLVYPIARGSGVGFTAIGATIFHPGKNKTLAVGAWLGILAIVVGVLWLGLSSRKKPSSSPAPTSVPSIPIALPTVPLTHSSSQTASTAHIESSDSPSVDIELEVSHSAPPNQPPVSSHSVALETQSQQPPPAPLRSRRMFPDSWLNNSVFRALYSIWTMIAGNNVFLSLSVGLSIASYSLVDAQGVNVMDPVAFLFFMFVYTNFFTMPLAFRDHDKIVEHVREHKRHVVFISFAALGGYLVILYVLTVASVLVVSALREVSVVFGAILGMIFLKEPCTFQKVAAILVILVGILLVKIF